MLPLCGQKLPSGLLQVDSAAPTWSAALQCVEDEWARDGAVNVSGQGSAFPPGLSCNEQRPLGWKVFFFFPQLIPDLLRDLAARWVASGGWSGSRPQVGGVGVFPVCGILCSMLVGLEHWDFFFFGHFSASDPGPNLSVCQPPRSNCYRFSSGLVCPVGLHPSLSFPWRPRGL